MKKETKEIAYVLIGEVKNGILLAKMSWRTRGTESSVLFDGARVLAREESHGDLVGFFHTHPEGFTQPSKRDDDTMAAWCFCFGKPLLCAISTSAGLRAWIYGARTTGSACAGTTDAGATSAGAAYAGVTSARREITRVQLFNKTILIAVLD